MSGDLVAPAKVAVLGNSASYMVVPERRSRHEGTYSEWLERLLVAHGLPTEVRNHGRWFDLIHEGSERWIRELAAGDPDVLIVHYGMGECQPNVLPTWASRHFMTWDQSVTGVRGWYRRRVSPRLWRSLRGWQRFAAHRAGRHTWRTRPKRVAGELRVVVARARASAMLVLVIDAAPPDDKIRHFLPGIDERRDAMNDALAAVVAELGDEHVRFVRASRVVEEMGVARALPDGLHFSALAHRRVADLLLAHVEPYLRDLARRRSVSVDHLARTTL